MYNTEIWVADTGYNQYLKSIIDNAVVCVRTYLSVGIIGMAFVYCILQCSRLSNKKNNDYR